MSGKHVLHNRTATHQGEVLARGASPCDRERVRGDVQRLAEGTCTQPRDPHSKLVPAKPNVVLLEARLAHQAESLHDEQQKATLGESSAGAQRAGQLCSALWHHHSDIDPRELGLVEHASSRPLCVDGGRRNGHDAGGASNTHTHLFLYAWVLG